MKHLFNESIAKFVYLRNKDKKTLDVFLIEEDRIRNTIINILSREGTHVSMAPRSNIYMITNKLIDFDVLIDGQAEIIKITEKPSKYGWQFRETFISEMINLAIDWIEKDRTKRREKVFNYEMELLSDINSRIDTLPILAEDPKILI